MTAAVVLTNTASRPCWLEGTPRSVTLLDDGGSTVSTTSRPLALPVNSGPVELMPDAPLPAFGAPPPHGSAWFLVTWTNWCGDGSPSVQSLLVILPAGGSITAPPAAETSPFAQDKTAPSCEDAHAASTVTLSRFQAPGA